MENLALKKISQAHACAVMQAAGLQDDAQQFTPETIAAMGQAFEITTAGGVGVFVVEKRGGYLWVHGAGGVKTAGLTAAGLGVIEALAVESECHTVAFETARPGLARLAKKTGYSVRAVIMKKRVK